MIPFVNLQNIIFKNGKIDNCWVGYSVMKLVDTESFQKIKFMQEGGNKKNDNFDMEILGGGVL